MHILVYTVISPLGWAGQGRGMLGGGGGCEREEEREGDFHPSPTALIDAKALKVLIKSSGHKLSGNAFDALNLFVRQLLVALAMGAGRAAKRQYQQINGSESEDVMTVPWGAVMETVRLMVPALEGWFSTWYEQLVQHVDSTHSGQLPSIQRIYIHPSILF